MISPPAYPLPSPTARAPDSAAQPEPLSRGKRSVGEPGKYWPQNSTLKIALYDYAMDDPYVLAVKKAASEWLPHINLTFEFVCGEDGDVRITQNLPGDHGGRSMIGTDAKNAPPYAPTMSLPADPGASSFAVTVMHEFGHMLGAHHEHQHPDANIPWNRPNLDRLFDQSELQTNFRPLPRSDIYDFSRYDPDSIMHYSIAPSWSTDNTFHSRNAMLSADDIAWANKAYPKARHQPGPI
ncbi:M12 family metallopeptidase [Pseudomonas spelaei]